MENKMRQGIGMIDPEQQRIADAIFHKNEEQEYLLLFVSEDGERKTFEFVYGRTNFIPFLKGYVDAGEIDINNSYVLTEEVGIEERMTVKEFAKHINKSLSEEDRIYIEDDEESEEQ